MTQLSFSTIWQSYATDKEAKVARDTTYWNMRAAGLEVRRFVNKKQLRKWAGLGIPDGRTCDVYEIYIYTTGVSRIDAEKYRVQPKEEGA